MITQFLESLGTPQEPSKEVEHRETDRRRVWKGVPGTEVATMLSRIEFPPKALEFSWGQLSPYIREQLNARELTNWTVAVLAGDEETCRVGKWSFKTSRRKRIERVKEQGLYIVRTALSPRDEALDLDEGEFAEALAATNAERAQEGEKPTSVPSGPKIRQIRGRDPRRALLLLYPLSPKELGHHVPVFGVVVSFPSSNSGRKVTYRFNTVEQRIEQA